MPELDLSGAMDGLCRDLCHRLPELGHIDPDRVLFSLRRSRAGGNPGGLCPPSFPWGVSYGPPGKTSVHPEKPRLGHLFRISPTPSPNTASQPPPYPTSTLSMNFSAFTGRLVLTPDQSGPLFVSRFSETLHYLLTRRAAPYHSTCTRVAFICRLHRSPQYRVLRNTNSPPRTPQPSLCAAWLAAGSPYTPAFCCVLLS